MFFYWIIFGRLEKRLAIWASRLFPLFDTKGLMTNRAFNCSAPELKSSHHTAPIRFFSLLLAPLSIKFFFGLSECIHESGTDGRWRLREFGTSQYYFAMSTREAVIRRLIFGLR